MDGGKSDFAPGKPPLSSEETHGLLRGESEGDFGAGGAMLKMCEHFIDAAKLIENVLPENAEFSKQVTWVFLKMLK